MPFLQFYYTEIGGKNQSKRSQKGEESGAAMPPDAYTPDKIYFHSARRYAAHLSNYH